VASARNPSVKERNSLNSKHADSASPFSLIAVFLSWSLLLCISPIIWVRRCSTEATTRSKTLDISISVAVRQSSIWRTVPSSVEMALSAPCSLSIEVTVKFTILSCNASTLFSKGPKSCFECFSIIHLEHRDLLHVSQYVSMTKSGCIWQRELLPCRFPEKDSSTEIWWWAAVASNKLCDAEQAGPRYLLHSVQYLIASSWLHTHLISALTSTGGATKAVEDLESDEMKGLHSNDLSPNDGGLKGALHCSQHSEFEGDVVEALFTWSSRQWRQNEWRQGKVLGSISNFWQILQAKMSSAANDNTKQQRQQGKLEVSQSRNYSMKGDQPLKRFVGESKSAKKDSFLPRNSFSSAAKDFPLRKAK